MASITISINSPTLEWTETIDGDQITIGRGQGFNNTIKIPDPRGLVGGLVDLIDGLAPDPHALRLSASADLVDSLTISLPDLPIPTTTTNLP